MSCCTKLAMARIFSIGELTDAVSSATFCLISGDGSALPRVRLSYQVPISCQLLNPLITLPDDGKNETTICPATPARGGISFSGRTAFTSNTVHCVWPVDAVGFASAKFSQV